MSSDLIRRSIGLTALTATLAVGAAGVAPAATLRQAHDFNQTLSPSFSESGAELTAVGNVLDDSHQDRSVFSFAPESPGDTAGFSLDEVYDVDPESFSIDLTFALEDTNRNVSDEDWQRVVDFRGGDPATGLYVKDGLLEWRNGATETTGTTPIADNAFARVTLVRVADDLRVYLNGNAAPQIVVTDDLPTISETDGVGFFADEDDTEQGAGYLGRLRLFDGGLTPPEVSGLAQFDVTAPSSIDGLGDSGAFVNENGVRWAGPFTTFGGYVTDDGTAPVSISGRVLDGANNPVAAGLDPWLGDDETFALDLEELSSRVGLYAELGALTDEGDYKLEATVADAAGNEKVDVLPFRLDKRAPQGFSVDTATTDDRTPVVGGSASVGARDEGVAHATVCKGSTCNPNDESDFVGFVEAAIVNGRWGSELKRFDTGLPVGDLPLGVYVVKAFHYDRLGNAAEVSKVFTVVAARPVPVPTPVVVTPPPVKPLLSPVALLARNRQLIVASLLKERLRGLLKDGKADVDVFTDRPADIIVQLFDGTAPKKVDPTAKAAAKKKKAKSRLIASGRRSFAVAGTGKLTVRLTKRGKALLKRKKSRRVSVRTIIVPKAGRTISGTTKLTIKR